MDILEDIKQNVVRREAENTAKLVEKALNEGLDPKDLLNKALIPAMDVVGNEYENGERYIPEMLMPAETINDGRRPWTLGSRG